ncbi:hypothetical protein ACVWYF_004271 [Hymenobacter sp. UYAg731]
MKKPFLTPLINGLSRRQQRGALLLALLGVAPGAFAQSSFGPATTYFSSGTSPLGVALGDVNSDGLNDIVMANQGTDNVSVLLGRTGTGAAYAAAVSYPTGTGTRPTGIALGDVNGDGRLDIVTANQQTGTVGIMLNSATAPGTFGAASTYLTGTSNTNIVALGDVNGDGRLDIAATNTGAGTVSVFLNSASPAGSFSPATTYASGLTAPIGITIGDVNADGRPDLVMGSNMGTGVGVLLASATTLGTFTPALTYASGSTGTVSVALGDVNGDGRTDLVTANSSGATVSVLLGTAGTGSLFATPVTYSSGGIEPNFAVLSDINGDGRLDIVVGNNGSGSIGVLTGRAAQAGTFAPATTYSSGGNGPIGLAVADLNNDGRRDIAVANYTSGTVGVLLNTYIVLANTPAQTAPDITLYPNPAHDAFAVLIPAMAGAPSTVQAELLNALGQVVQHQTAVLPASGTRLAVETAALAPGVYTLRLRAGTTTMARRVVLQ